MLIIVEKEYSITSTIRLSERQFEYIKEKSREVGMSQNSFMNMLMVLGRKLYDGDIKIVLPER